MTALDRCKTKAEELTAEFVRSVLDYDPATGVFRWKARADVGDSWNRRYANKEAGSIFPDNYRYIRIKFAAYKAHRLAWLYVVGDWPSNDIDHIDGDGANNRWLNLRAATRAENTRNRKVNRGKLAGLKGTHRLENGRWQARIMFNGRHIHLGVFADADEAHLAYCKAARQYFGDFARRA